MDGLFYQYTQLSALNKGLLFLPLGLVAGSFASVILHRVPLGRSFGRSRSRCPNCDHALGAMDLVPLVSYVWLRGRCRYCRGPIPWRYPALELAAALLAGGAGYLGGWSAGAAAVLLWPAAVWLLSCKRVKASANVESGTTLVEVLIALALLTVVVIPMLDLGAHVRGGTAFHRQIAVSLASSKIEELANYAYRTSLSSTNWPADGSGTEDVGLYSFQLEWRITPVSLESSTVLRQAEVSVTCLNCPRPMPAVTVVSYLVKSPQT